MIEHHRLLCVLSQHDELLASADQGLSQIPEPEVADIFADIANQYWSAICQKAGDQDELCQAPLVALAEPEDFSTDNEPSEAAGVADDDELEISEDDLIGEEEE